jgi:hypothetical protein
LAQSPVRVGVAAAVFELLLHAAASSEAEAAAISRVLGAPEERLRPGRWRSLWLRVLFPRVPRVVNIIVLDP